MDQKLRCPVIFDGPGQNGADSLHMPTSLYHPITFDKPNTTTEQGKVDGQKKLHPGVLFEPVHFNPPQEQPVNSEREVAGFNAVATHSPNSVGAMTQKKKSVVGMISEEAKHLSAYDMAQDLMSRLPMRLIKGALYAFDGKVYRFVTVDVMQRLIVKHCRDYIKTVGTPSIIKQIYDFIRAEPNISRDGLRQNVRYVVMENGLLDLGTLALRPFDPHTFVTARLNGKFLREKAGQCPTFNAFISTITGGDTLLEKRIWEAIGYALVPDSKGKVFFLFQGVPNSGKSLLGDFIASCFDEDAVTSMDFNALGLQFGPSSLVGKSLCQAMDLAAAPWDAKAVGVLKALTGNDLISADVKYQPRIMFRNTATFIFGSNHAVTTATNDEAFFERLVVIPFAHNVPHEKQDRTLLDKLIAERDAIISTAILHYIELRKNNYRFSGDFGLNEVVSKERGKAVSPDQAIADYFCQECELEDGAITFTEDLYAHFSERYPGLADMGTFSNKLYAFSEWMFSGRVKKIRKRREGAGNPVSAFQGLKLVDCCG